MKIFILTGAIFSVGLVAVISSDGTSAQESTDKNQTSTVIFLVRHAEKEADASRDPALNDAGTQRAERLAHMLKDTRLTAVHSTNYRRTKMTANPVSTELDLDIKTYNPARLGDFADTLKKAGGRHLVVGHSNTTPVLVKLLNGNPGTPIDDKSEFDRLYIVTVSDDGSVSTVLLRYGN